MKYQAFSGLDIKFRHRINEPDFFLVSSSKTLNPFDFILMVESLYDILFFMTAIRNDVMHVIDDLEVQMIRLYQ